MSARKSSRSPGPPADVPVAEKKSPARVLKSLGIKFGKTLGKGTYSKVCVAVDAAGGRHACKIINKKNAGRDFIRKFLPRELQIVGAVRHEHVVCVSKILEVGDTVYMFMDYCANGDLLEYVRNRGCFAEERARPLMRQLASAIAYLHGKDIAHRDVKCENVLLTRENVVKLADFGFARCCRREDGARVFSDTFCGSAAYAAPEILQGTPYDPKMYDIWAMGCVLYVVLLATMPFDDSNVKKMLKVQMDRSVSATAAQNWIKNPHLRTLLCCLLEPDVRLRPKIGAVVGCKWFREEQTEKPPTEGSPV